MNCPKCDSSRFFYVQRVYEYHKIDNVDDGNITLEYLDGTSMDMGYGPLILCEDCTATFNIYLEPIDLSEEDEPCPRDKIEVIYENT